MFLEVLKESYQAGLEKLSAEIKLYRNESLLWKVEKQITNSGGNLCLHLIGNLNAYIGVGLAKTTYIRRRELEFSSNGIAREVLLNQIAETSIVVDKGLSSLSSDQLQEFFPVKIWDQPKSIEYSLIWLATHFNYHLGQVNYHRRMVEVV